MQQVQEQAETDEYSLLRLGPVDKSTPYNVVVDVDGRRVTMEIDTGVAVSLISAVTFKELWSGKSLNPATVQLCSYLGEKIPVAGKVEVTFSYKSQVAKAPLVIILCSGPILFGRNWLE